MPIPIFDSHIDLAWSALSFDRNLTLPVSEIRQREQGMTDHPARGKNTLSLPELRNTPIPVFVGTLLARSSPNRAERPQILRTDLDHAIQIHAASAATAQLTYYQLLEQQKQIKLIRTAKDLQQHWLSVGSALRTTTTNQPSPVRSADPTLGLILSMEGADPILTPDHLHLWHAAGLRALGSAHYGQSHYAHGTGTSGPLSARGIELLRAMDDLHMILDVTHLCDQSMSQAFDYFDGPLLASHHNCRALVPGDRQLTDEQIKTIIQRNGVIGVALDAWMLHPNWIRGQTSPSVVSLADLANHIDHINQLAGNALHTAIGSDLDGGFGTEQTPHDLNTISDLQKLAPILQSRGYAEADIAAIFHGNWLRFFTTHLPA